MRRICTRTVLHHWASQPSSHQHFCLQIWIGQTSVFCKSTVFSISSYCMVLSSLLKWEIPNDHRVIGISTYISIGPRCTWWLSDLTNGVSRGGTARCSSNSMHRIQECIWQIYGSTKIFGWMLYNIGLYMWYYSFHKTKQKTAIVTYKCLKFIC